MAARHKMSKKATGGIATAGGNPYVLKDAEDTSDGGTSDKKRGGKVGKMHGGKSRLRLDKPGRKSGGRVGADSSPLSSANRTASAETSPKSQTGGASD